MADVLTGSRAAIYLAPESGDDVLAMECAGWDVKFNANAKQFGSCTTGKYMNATSGRKGATGTIRGYLDDTNELSDMLSEGDYVVLVLYFDVDNDRCHVIPAIIGEIDEKAAIGDDGLTEWSATFMSKGAYLKNQTRAVVSGSGSGGG